MKNPWLYLITILCFGTLVSYANVLHVGNGQQYANLEQAAAIAIPGDTIRVHGGSHTGGMYIEDLQGTSQAWIVIEAADGEQVIYEGGTNAWQFTDAAYVEIRGFIFQHQTGNGLNFDDGGTYATPTHHIRFIECTFRDMSASGNNDQLKLSGMDSFEINQCTFLNGAEGGSGIDMVGCHDGHVFDSHFENLGSNCVQMKGGTRNILIERNFFKNGGQRTLNLGGSTDLEFFRPIDAPYEAAELKVYSNVFIGSVTPVAFVGSILCEVINNTFYLPEKWALRILQETVDISRFPPCGQNTYRNNIIYYDQRVSIDCNIGPDTDPGSFTFSNNLWFHSDNLSWPGPDLPAPDVDHLVGVDPLFENASNENFALQAGSPAIGEGLDVSDPTSDYNTVAFNQPRSIGAFEGNPLTGIHGIEFNPEFQLSLFPNPASGWITLESEFFGEDEVDVSLLLPDGKIVNQFVVYADVRHQIKLDINFLPAGLYVVLVKTNNQKSVIHFYKK